MATLKDIRKRIHSVKNTQKITKAMKMVAAAKLRRAQQAVQGGRPYLNKLQELIQQIAERLPAKDKNVLFKAREEVKNVAVFVMTSNRGLCGGVNSNLAKKAFAFVKTLRAEGKIVNMTIIGRKGRDFMNSRKMEFARFEETWAEKMDLQDARNLVSTLVEQFKSQQIDECFFIFNNFVSAMTQTPSIEQILPIGLKTEQKTDSFGIDFLYEPSKQEILDDVLPRYLAGKIFACHKEALASELGARMTAMDSATNNASEMLGSLTLLYNRARQAAITVELLDIVNGAESLKG